MAQVHPVQKLSLLERFYIGELLRGIAVTTRHFFKNIRSPQKNTITIQYPDQEREVHERWRGRHRLTTRDDGSVRCVACMCCAWACPARCIHIEPERSATGELFKAPAKFEIDELKCVFCGLCVDACPEDAIRMDTGIYAIASYSREDAYYDMEFLRDPRKMKVMSDMKERLADPGREALDGARHREYKGLTFTTPNRPIVNTND